MITFWDSRHIQVATYTVVDEESEIQIKQSADFRARRETIGKNNSDNFRTHRLTFFTREVVCPSTVADLHKLGKPY